MNHFSAQFINLENKFVFCLDKPQYIICRSQRSAIFLLQILSINMNSKFTNQKKMIKMNNNFNYQINRTFVAFSIECFRPLLF
jgi:Mn2+/Fe2+ NRAMP family transporter